MSINGKTYGQKKLKKIFGVGPVGATISLIILVTVVCADAVIKLPIVEDCAGLMKTLGIVVVILGVGLHFWSFSILRNWWVDDKLCTDGPFRYLRHPMYAAWITLICPGLAFYLNSWFYLIWIIILHLLWHRLVKKEEIVMIELFGNIYKDYARRTGRFFPKIFNL